MQTFENHTVVFRNDVQRRRFETLSQRDFAVSIYPDDFAMRTLSIRDSVVYLLNQIGWTNFALDKKFSTYHNLTLEFLSSLYYDSTRGFGFGRGLATFRLFGNKYRFTHHEFTELLGFPNGPDAVTKTPEDAFMQLDLDFF